MLLELTHGAEEAVIGGVERGDLLLLAADDALLLAHHALQLHLLGAQTLLLLRQPVNTHVSTCMSKL